MRSFFAILTIGFILLGFFIPFVWVFALVAGVIAIGSAPSGVRADGKRKTGGLLGGVWDDVVIGYKMKDCPYCKMKIDVEATKCPHCAEWVTPKQ
ncbi:MAG: hypothetical protein Q8P56_05005 [Candidatus Uhrbacteria bacterium]|nr:hypothetical protein [Candidatus Uhrbacteria bacterium]